MRDDNDGDALEMEESSSQYSGNQSSRGRVALESSWMPVQDVDEDEGERSSHNLEDPLLSGTPEQAGRLPPPRTTLPPPPSDRFPLPLRYYNQLPRVLSQENRRYLRELVRRAGNYLAYATLLIMLVVLPNVIYQGISAGHVDLAAYHSAGVMVLGTIVLSLRLVYLHLTHWYMPEVQKYVVRILWMVPIYAVQSWLSLRFHSSRIYIDTFRDLYEAYVIASFVYYLIELLGGEEGLVHILEGKDDPSLGQHSFPLRLILEPWELGEDFMLQCKHGVLQYVVFKIVATLLTFLCMSVGVYGEGQFHWMVAYPYLCFFQNVSVCYALYSLVMLYSAVDEELRYPVNWRPLGKFLCVKGVVFFCWWQGVLIFYLEAHGIIRGAGGRWSAEDVANGLIDYCIVLEMVLFAIAHSYTFTYKEYLPENLPPEYRVHGRPAAPVSGTTMAATTLNSTNPQVSPIGERVVSLTESRNGDDDENHPSVEDTAAPESAPRPPRGYRPPAMLEQPMGFSRAFWSSTLPSETIEDIQRLRIGRELLVAVRPRTASQEVVAAVDSTGGENDQVALEEQELGDANDEYNDPESPVATDVDLFLAPES